MLLEHVGQAHCADFQASVHQASVAGECQHMRAKAAHRCFFDRHDNLMRGDQVADHFFVKRLCKAQVGDGGAQALGIQRLCRLHRFGQTRAERENGDLFTFTHDPAFADFQLLRHVRHRNARAIAAWIAERDWPAVVQDSSIGHVDQFRFVGWRHDDHIGQGRQIGNVERTRMRAAIGADEASAVNGEAYRQILDRDVVHDLVIGALQEGRVNRAEGTHPLCRQSSSKGDGMLFSDADIERAFGMRGREFVDAGAARHCGGYRANFWVSFRQLGQRFAKDVLIGWRTATRALVLLTCDHVEFDDAMIFVRRRFGRGVTFALLRDDMDQHGAFGIVADIFEDGDQLVEIMAVDRANIIKAEFFEQGAAHGHAARKFFRL